MPQPTYSKVESYWPIEILKTGVITKNHLFDSGSRFKKSQSLRLTFFVPILLLDPVMQIHLSGMISSIKKDTQRDVFFYFNS